MWRQLSAGPGAASRSWVPACSWSAATCSSWICAWLYARARGGAWMLFSRILCTHRIAVCTPISSHGDGRWGEMRSKMVGWAVRRREEHHRLRGRKRPAFEAGDWRGNLETAGPSARKGSGPNPPCHRRFPVDGWPYSSAWWALACDGLSPCMHRGF